MRLNDYFDYHVCHLGMREPVVVFFRDMYNKFLARITTTYTRYKLNFDPSFDYIFRGEYLGNRVGSNIPCGQIIHRLVGDH